VSGFDEIDYASLTDVGVRRSHNQDAHVAVPATDLELWRERGHVFLVADGMGGHAVGELASKMAVDNIPHVFSKHLQEGTAAALRKAFSEANASIHNRGKQNREFHRMGTTGTALVLRPEGAWVGHVGDSRAYRIRGGVIEQLSFDHRMVWEMARRQRKRPEELLGSIQSNIITRSLGPEPLVQVDVEGPHPVEPGDVYLLCSDGLSGQVTDREIGAVASILPPDEACRFLVHLANLQGGPDNTTVIIVRIGGDAPATGSDSVTDVVFGDALAPRPPLWPRVWAVAQRLPWSFILLLLGIVLGVGAVYLAINRVPGGLFTFVLAALALGGGLVGLLVQNLREKRREAEPGPQPLRVYRQTPCQPDDVLLQRLIEATNTLERNVRSKEWNFDEEQFRDRLTQAQNHVLHARPRDAFREQCRAMLTLMEAVHQQRHRQETFSPIWDRPSVG
jgi:protein phosphatase